MPRLKRNPLLYVLVAACVIFVLYSISAGNDHDMPFRKSTEERIQKGTEPGTSAETFRKTTPEEIAHSVKGPHAQHPDIELDRKIQAAMDRYETAAATQGRASPFAEVEEQSVAGRKMMPKPKEKPKYPVGEEEAFNGGRTESATDSATVEAKAELDDILKKGPIIIFSKSYCGFSKRAKHLLLDTYTIIPTPYVVELDQLTRPLTSTSASGEETEIVLGKKLQDLLAELTGRQTVPNILVNARSIGGSDDIARLDDEGKLVEEIKRLGGSKIREMHLKTDKS